MKYIKYLPHLVFVGLLIVLVLQLREFIFDNDFGLTPAGQSQLAPDDSLLVTVDQGKVRVEKRTKEGSEVSLIDLPPSGSSQISVKNKGEVVVKNKTAGVDFQLGGGFLVTDRLYGALDGEIAYFGRLSLHAGVGIRSASDVIGYVGGGYRLDQLRLNNTSVVAGFTTQKTLFVGCVVRF